MSDLLEKIHRAETLDERRRLFITALRGIHERGKECYRYVRIGCVVGVPNEAAMASWMRKIWREANFPVFAAPHIVPRMLNGLAGSRSVRIFWANCFRLGYITDLYVVPGSEQDLLVSELLHIAKQDGINVIYLKE